MVGHSPEMLLGLEVGGGVPNPRHCGHFFETLPPKRNQGVVSAHSRLMECDQAAGSVLGAEALKNWIPCLKAPSQGIKQWGGAGMLGALHAAKQGRKRGWVGCFFRLIVLLTDAGWI